MSSSRIGRMVVRGSWTRGTGVVFFAVLLSCTAARVQDSADAGAANAGDSGGGCNGVVAPAFSCNVDQVAKMAKYDPVGHCFLDPEEVPGICRSSRQPGCVFTSLQPVCAFP